MNTVYLVANGDLRLSANQKCEPAQASMEKALVGAIEREGFNVKRAHTFDETKGHGFIDSQKMGLHIFGSIPQDAPLRRRRGRVAIQPAFTRRFNFSQRSYSDGRQLERDLAGVGGLAEFERIPYQSRGEVQHALERGVHR